MLDHLGSVVGMFSSTGSYEGGYSYSPYGETRAASTNSTVAQNTLRYIAGHHDDNGLYKLGARYYDASQGRFTQMDPSGQEAHPYAYAGCNPINSKDPQGTSCTSAFLVYAGATFVAVATAVGGIVTAPTGVGAVLFGIALTGELLVVTGSYIDVLEQCF
ncbi:RHS repeat-associated core domain-containing protein [Okibacterium endophyticum]